MSDSKHKSATEDESILLHIITTKIFLEQMSLQCKKHHLFCISKVISLDLM